MGRGKGVLSQSQVENVNYDIASQGKMECKFHKLQCAQG